MRSVRSHTRHQSHIESGSYTCSKLNTLGNTSPEKKFHFEHDVQDVFIIRDFHRSFCRIHNQVQPNWCFWETSSFDVSARVPIVCHVCCLHFYHLVRSRSSHSSPLSSGMRGNFDYIIDKFIKKLSMVGKPKFFILKH